MLAIGGRPAAAMPDEEVETRRAFVEGRLAAGTSGSNLWWYSWLGLVGAYWGTHIVVAATTDDDDQRVRSIASAAKSTLTVSSIAFLPNPARTAQERVEAMDASTPEVRRARLDEGERLLRYAAHRAEQKVAWPSHVINAVVNGATAAILIYGYDQDPTPTLLSAAGGFVAVEISYYTYPQRPRDDLREYDARFPSSRPPPPAVRWDLVPAPGGLRLAASF